MRSSIMMEMSFEDVTKRSGNEVYMEFRHLVEKHGQQNAEELRDDKKRKQRESGDAYEGCPWWMVHPDFPDKEVTCLILVVGALMIIRLVASMNPVYLITLKSRPTSSSCASTMPRSARVTVARRRLA